MKAASSGMMTSFIYRLGMATGRDTDEGRAFLQAFGLGLKLERVKRGLSQDEFADPSLSPGGSAVRRPPPPTR
jgi:hypothetical protein